LKKKTGVCFLRRSQVYEAVCEQIRRLSLNLPCV